MKIPIDLPDDLHPDTQSLVIRFAESLAEKLRSAEKKYGYSAGWMSREWIDDGQCRARFTEHIAKGDPRDVAAYCAFLWHHGASTKPAGESPFDAQWYPVSDMIPDHGKPVLLVWVRRPGKEHVMRTGFWRENLGFRGSGNVKFKTEPTHWRELPVLNVVNPQPSDAPRSDRH